MLNSKNRSERLQAQDLADEETIKNFSDDLVLCIYEHNIEVVKIAISPKATVAELIKTVRRKLKTSNSIICLASLNGKEVLDYLLLNPDNSLAFLKNHEKLYVIHEQQLADYGRPQIGDFHFIKCLGQGGSASVFLVRHRLNGRLYALKQIEKSYFVEFKRMQQILRQRRIMAEMLCDFPFVSQLYSTFESQKHLNFVLEFYPGGQFFYHLQMGRLNEEEAKLYFCQMVVTFEHLHKNKIVYRDLKQPENVLIDINGHSRLSDFGLCKLNLSKDDLTTSYCGSVQYMAPQVKNSVGYNYSVDFYALGAFLFEMVVGVPPYYNDQPLIFPPTCSKGFTMLVSELIQQDMSQRISSFLKIKNSTWLKGVNWEKIIKKQHKMPLKINPHSSYIHNQFKCVSTYELNHVKQNTYDKLFDFFFYMKDDPQGISESYLSFSNSNKPVKRYKEFSSKPSSASTSTKRKKQTSSKHTSSSSSRQNLRKSPQTKQFKRDGPRQSIKCIYTTRNKQLQKYPLKFRESSPHQQKLICFKKPALKQVKSTDMLSKLGPMTKRT